MLSCICEVQAGDVPKYIVGPLDSHSMNLWLSWVVAGKALFPLWGLVFLTPHDISPTPYSHAMPGIRESRTMDSELVATEVWWCPEKSGIQDMAVQVRKDKQMQGNGPGIIRKQKEAMNNKCIFEVIK